VTESPSNTALPSSDAEETVQAIRQGSVDAVVVQGAQGPQIIMLQGADAPYHLLVERMSDGALSLDPEGSILYVNARLSAMVEEESDTLIGRSFASLFSGTVPNLAAGDHSTETLLTRSASDPLPVAVWMRPMTIAGVTGTLVTVTDLSMHRRAEEIANAERFARSILEQATEAILVLSQEGRITHASEFAAQMSRKPLIGRTFSEAFCLDASDASDAPTLSRFSQESLDQLLATKAFHGVEVRFRTPELAAKTFLLSTGPLLNDSKDSVGSIVTLTDITERKRAEEQQTMMVAELNHRVKNILAIVQSVAGQTMRNASSLQTFNSVFSGRIQALSIAHDILTQTRWIGIGLAELLEKVLAPYRDGSRIALNGPPTLLPARSVLPLSMVIHELATNASKYGALSEPAGELTVSWDLTNGKASRVHVNWLERGGPRVQKTRVQGFGTTLIERVVTYDLDGASALDYAPEGVTANLSFPLHVETSPEDLPRSVSQPA
jgi:PAS domain S-box-containing protein